MKYNVFLGQNLCLRLTADMRLKSNARWFLEENRVYRKAACRLYRFLWPLFSL